MYRIQNTKYTTDTDDMSTDDHLEEILNPFHTAAMTSRAQSPVHPQSTSPTYGKS